MANNPVPVAVDRYLCFPTSSRFMFSIVGKTKDGDDVVISRSYYYFTARDAEKAATVTRGKNVNIPIVWVPKE